MLTSQIIVAMLQHELGCQPSINIYFLSEHWKYHSKVFKIVTYVICAQKMEICLIHLCFFKDSLIQQLQILTNMLFLIGLEEMEVEIIFAFCKFHRMIYMKEIHHCSFCSNKQLILL
jgi:hypothetical protein